MKFFWCFLIIFLYPVLLYSAPAPVTNLSVRSTGFRHIVLQWTAPGGPEGPPTWYEIRTSSYRVIVDENDWNNNSSLTGYPYRIKFSTTTTAGFLENRVVSSLVNGQTYFFAIKSSTDNINWSNLDTSSPEPQSTPRNNPPGDVSDYNYPNPPPAVVYSSTATLRWSAVTNAGGIPVGTDNLYDDSVSSYTLWYSTTSNFAVKSVVEGITATTYTTPPLLENTTYYWRVYAKDIEGLLSQNVVGNPQFVINATSEPPTAFTLIQPVNDYIETGTLTPTLYWSQSFDYDPYDSVVYDVYITTVSNFLVSVTTKVVGVSQLSWTLQWSLTENARYFWKVHARDSSGLERVSSSTGTFRLNTVNEPPQSFSLLWPTSGIMVFTSSPTLQWSVALDLDPGNTVYYGISYSSTTSSPPDPVAFDILTTYYQILNLEEDAVYWWRVVAKSVPDNLTTLSSPVISSFVVNAINLPPNNFALLSSSGVIKTQTPSFIWEVAADPDGDAVKYNLYYSSNPSFYGQVTVSNLVTSSHAVISALNENTTYWWYVAAFDVYGAVRYSTTWYIVINAIDENPDAFDLAAPADNAVVSYLKPTLEWQSTTDPDPFDYVEYYTLSYSTDSSFGVKSDISPLHTTSYTFLTQLLNNTTYHWYVTAHSKTSGFTTTLTRKFITANLPPSPFELVSPSGVISTNTPTLLWQRSSDPEEGVVVYDLSYSTKDDFSTYTSSLGVITTFYTLPVLQENTTYWWKVIAKDDSGNYRNSNNLLHFIVNAQEEHPSNFALTSPENNSIIESIIPVFSWTPSSDPDPFDYVRYNLWYSTHPDFSYKVVVENLVKTSYQVSLDNPLLADLTYYWMVWAFDKTNRFVSSGVWSFYVKPSVRPSAPHTFSGKLSDDKKYNILSWLPPTTNSDGSTLGGLSGYRIYRAFSFDEVFNVQYVVFVDSSTLSWSDNAVGVDVFYLVRAVNDLGVVGEPSVVIKVGSENLSYHYNVDKTVILVGRQDILLPVYRVDISTLALPADDTETVSNYIVKVFDDKGSPLKTFSKPLQLRIKIKESSHAVLSPSYQNENNYAIYYFNGVEWINLGGSYDGSYLVVETDSVGNFRVREVARATEFKILSVWPKVFTPNNDGKNDEFNITFENPYSDNVEGIIYDIAGFEVARMERKTNSRVVWNGVGTDGRLLPTGVYIYQLKVGSKIKNGTVVVAR